MKSDDTTTENTDKSRPDTIDITIKQKKRKLLKLQMAQ